jgi:CRP/FNR family transcriptional regulator, cyclic AMP receptor protein
MIACSSGGTDDDREGNMSGGAQVWIDAVGYLASLLVFATFCMRTMVALRIAAIGSNICFIAFGIAAHVYPVLILHLVLLPLNTMRTVEMMRLRKRIEVAATGDLSFEPLKPFMKAEHYPSGHILFQKGDFADRMFIVSSGQLRVDEMDVVLGRGDLVGEIGVFSSDQVRTSTAHCLSDVELLSIAKQHMAEICFQNPAISFYLLSLITNRLLADMAHLDRQRNSGDGPREAVAG